MSKNTKVSPGIINMLLRRAQEYNVPETHPLIKRVKTGDKAAADELEDSLGNIHRSGQYYNPYTNPDIGTKKYGMAAVKGYGESEGSFLWGKPEWKEQVPLYSPEQQQYMNEALKFASERMPQLYEQMGKRANGGMLTEMFGNNASQGFEKLIGQLGGSLGEYVPQALASGAVSALGGGGLGDILKSLITSAAGQYTANNIRQSPTFQNISEGVGNYYNQGMRALGDLWNNRGDYRR